MSAIARPDRLSPDESARLALVLAEIGKALGEVQTIMAGAENEDNDWGAFLEGHPELEGLGDA
jgi:hypothetical protein